MRALRSELDAFEDALRELEDQIRDEYDTLGEQLDDCYDEVLQFIQAKVDTEGVNMNLDKPVDPALEAQRKLRVTAEEKLRKLQEEMDKVKAELSEQRQNPGASAQASAPQQQQEDDAAGEMEQDDADPLWDVDVSLLPDVPDPAPEAVPVLDRAWHVIHLSRWSQAARALSAEIIGIPLEDLRKLLGPLWTSIFPLEDPTPQQPLPLSVICLLEMALTKVANKLTQRPRDEREKTKQEARSVLQSIAKKQRTV